MSNHFVISYDAGYLMPYGAARFADIGLAGAGNVFAYFATHAEAVAYVEAKGGVVFFDDVAEV